MDKAKEISARWEQIKPQIGELVRLCHEVESHYEVTADAYQRGYEEGYKDGYNEPGKGKIQVGDEVFYGNTKGIVIRPEDGDRYASVFTAIGEHISAENKDLTKTGRHFSEIAEVLQKMKEADNG